MNRHRFEPARLLLGLLLMGAASVYVLDALGERRVPVWALLVLVPASLLAAALTSGATFAVRRLVRRRRTRAGGVVPGRMPMDELRDGYERSRPAGARGDDRARDDAAYGGERGPGRIGGTGTD
jgi:hypothetical protein